VRRRALIEEFCSASRALDATTSGAVRTTAEAAAERALANAVRLGAEVLIESDPLYPAALHELHAPPAVLFAIGDLSLLARPAVAIVGTRRATAYGERVTQGLAGRLARGGVVVVSGLARGIDAAAHRAALNADGSTVAVLGTGIDRVYPRAHASLQRDIAARGLLISEELPGERADGGSFPRRNRIIAALAKATFVVEAGARSGALITAEHALELNRVLAAVPGPIDSAASAGSNLLIRDGAIVLAEVADALALFGLSPALGDVPPPVDPAERAVWAALASGGAQAEALGARTGLPARECLAAISALELAGMVDCDLTGLVRRRP
jgi:DNA processing protein